MFYALSFDHTASQLRNLHFLLNKTSWKPFPNSVYGSTLFFLRATLCALVCGDLYVTSLPSLSTGVVSSLTYHVTHRLHFKKGNC